MGEWLISLLVNASFSPLVEFGIQTVATANPGNSGGLLVNNSGEVIDIITMGIGEVPQNSGVNFAIPIDDCKTFIQKSIGGN